jgi:AraC-like DNA-binding protein
VAIFSAELPFAGHEVFDVDSLAAYDQWRGENEGEAFIQPLRTDVPFGGRLRRRLIGGAILEVATGSAAGAKVSPPPPSDAVQTLIPLSGAGIAKTARGELAFDARQGAVFSRTAGAALELQAGWSDFCVIVEPRVFDSAYQAWTAVDAPRTFHYDGRLPWENAGQLRWLTGALFREVDEAGEDQMIATLLEGWTLALMRLLGPLREDDLQPAPLPSLQNVRAAEAYMEAHLQEPLRLHALCARLGIGMRALQKGFVRWRGQTPQQALHAMRLRHARALLLAGGTGTVTHAATKSGIRHMGRFSVGYRRAFGESPSATLRRRKPLPFSMS